MQEWSLKVVAAYLMQSERLDPDMAMASIKSVRHVVQPNDGFIQQLAVWKVRCSLTQSLGQSM